MVYSIENEYLKVTVTDIGGNLSGIYDKVRDREVLWQGDNKSWKGTDICIFPFIGRLKDGYYTVDGARYEMPRHGVCRGSTFTLSEDRGESITLSYRYNDDTLAVYPYQFRIDVRYTLSGRCLSVEYRIYNLGNRDMYYGVGGHPAFNVAYVECGDSTDTSMNKLLLDREYDLTAVALDKSCCFVTGEEYYGRASELVTDKRMFDSDTLILRNSFHSLRLIRGDGGGIKFETDAPYIALWTHQTFGGYICIEPWWSLPDENSPHRELCEKYSLNKLGAGAICTHKYVIEVE